MFRLIRTSAATLLLATCPAWGQYDLQLTVTPPDPWETDPVVVRVSDEFSSTCYEVCDAVGSWGNATHFHIEWYIRHCGCFCLQVITPRWTDFPLGPLAPGGYQVTATERVTAPAAACPTASQTQTEQTTFTVYARCDFDKDGLVGAPEITTLVAVLLGDDTDPGHVAAADMNGDGAANGKDVEPFVVCVIANG